VTLFWLTLFLRCTIYNNVGFVNLLSAHLSVHSKKSAVSLELRKLPNPFPKARFVICSGRSSVRPNHLFALCTPRKHRRTLKCIQAFQRDKLLTSVEIFDCVNCTISSNKLGVTKGFMKRSFNTNVGR